MNGRCDDGGQSMETPSEFDAGKLTMVAARCAPCRASGDLSSTARIALPSHGGNPRCRSIG
jgi:hypothetical protein